MNTKQNLQLLLFFVATTFVSGQQLYLEAGKISSSFDYENSQGVELDNLQSSNHTFMSLGYRTNIPSISKLNSFFGIGYSGYGAIGSDAALDGILEWDVNYLELHAGLDYGLLTIKKVEFYLKGMISTGFLVQGTQSLNDEIINLKKEDGFSNTMINFKAGVGMMYPVSNDLSFYAQYLLGKSLNQSGKSNDESLSINSHSISFGVLINLLED